MADWTAPIHQPKIPDDKFYQQKAKYVAEHGYRVSIPSWDDIIHVKTFQPMTENEIKAWKKKDYSQFSAARLQEITQEKERKREAYMRMMQSPVPDVVSKAGGILTALDDAQDAISTLAFVARLGVKVLPKVAARILGGPIGWALTAADVISFVNHIGQKATLPLPNKRMFDDITHDNPFSKKAKAKRAKKLMTANPTKAVLIEAAQTTDNIFGIGLSLGPIMGLAQDVFYGVARTLRGDKVQWGSTVPEPDIVSSAAGRCLKSAALSHVEGMPLTDEERMMLYIATSLSAQCIEPYMQDDNPLDHITNINDIIVPVPQNNNVLTQEIFSEDGLDINTNIFWPQTGTQYAPIAEITSGHEEIISSQLRDYGKRGTHSHEAMIASAAASQAAEYMISSLEGIDSVRQDWTVSSKYSHKLIAAGLTFNPTLSDYNRRTITEIIENHETHNICLSLDEFTATIRAYTQRKDAFIPIEQ